MYTCQECNKQFKTNGARSSHFTQVHTRLLQKVTQRLSLELPQSINIPMEQLLPDFGNANNVCDFSNDSFDGMVAIDNNKLSNNAGINHNNWEHTTLNLTSTNILD